jgi:hypothetical protein
MCRIRPVDIVRENLSHYIDGNYAMRVVIVACETGVTDGLTGEREREV